MELGRSAPMLSRLRLVGAAAMVPAPVERSEVRVIANRSEILQH